MSFGNAAAERAALETTYEDTADILRKVEKADGAIDRLSDEPVYTGVSCALSRRSDSSKQTSAQQDVSYDCVLFMAPEPEVLPGDSVVVTRFWHAQTFEAVGLPAVYATHQEVFLKGRGLA